MLALILVLVVAISAPFIAAERPPVALEDVPHPYHNYRECGRNKPGYICDQHLYLSKETDELDGLVQQVFEGAGMDMPCSDSPGVKGYHVGVAIVDRMDDGGKGTRPASLAEEFAHGLHEKWNLGDAKCKNGIMLFIALGDRAFSVNVGNDARGRLTGARVEALLNKIGPHLSSKNYAKALKIFLIGVDSHMKGPIDKSGPPYALLGLLGGAFGAVVYAATIESTTKSDKLTDQIKQIKSDRDKVYRNEYQVTSCPSKILLLMNTQRPECKYLPYVVCFEDLVFPLDDEIEERTKKGTKEGRKRISQRRTREVKPSRKAFALSCDHVFCEDDIKKWTKKNDTCPICHEVAKNNGLGQLETVTLRPLASRRDMNDVTRIILLNDLWYRLFMLRSSSNSRIPLQALTDFRTNPQDYDFNWSSHVPVPTRRVSRRRSRRSRGLSYRQYQRRRSRSPQRRRSRSRERDYIYTERLASFSVSGTF